MIDPFTRRLVRVLIGFGIAGLFGLSAFFGFGSNGAGRPTAIASDASRRGCATTTEIQNIALARSWHEDVINLRNPAVLQTILAPEVIHHAAGGYPNTMTIDGVAAMMDDFLVAFPDLHYTFDLFIVQDAFVVERYTATGTLTQPLQDIPATGRTATWTGINIFRIECGRIVEVWSEVDALSRNQQLRGDTTPAR